LDLGSIFPRKAVGIAPAAFLHGSRRRRVARSPRRELCSWPENYGDSSNYLMHGLRISHMQEKRTATALQLAVFTAGLRIPLSQIV
jgi:hypothetical protein